MTAPVLSGPSPTSGGPAPFLSDRQLTVLQHVANGLSIPETARAMHLAVGTIHHHQQVIVTRLRAKNITAAILIACHAGILDGKPRRHGDHAGYAAHAYRNEEPCDACRAGESAYRAKQRAARRTTGEEAA